MIHVQRYNTMKLPQKLQKGDRIAIVAPAKSIEPIFIQEAVTFFEESGFNTSIGENCLQTFHYFAGTISQRLADFQKALDDPEIKAICCARGGYGSIQIMEFIDWTTFIKHPKWIIGFSDITIFHLHVFSLGIESLHATMPLNFKENTKESIGSLILAIQNKQLTYEMETTEGSLNGFASGKLIGGNLSILYSMLGSMKLSDFQGNILFIEDLAEQLYHIDRMFYALRRMGILNVINGLVVGGMTDMKDTAVSFGGSVIDIIHAHAKKNPIPVWIGFPAGHINDNRALIMGRSVSMEVNPKLSKLLFL